MKLFAGLLASILLGIASQGLAEPGPHWGSDQLRAARSLAGGAGFQASVKTTIAGDQAKTQTSVVTLTADFNEIVSGTQHALDDFALCRTLGWTEGAATLENQSCYADPAFRLNELSNRQQLNLMLGAVQKPGAKAPEALLPYWSEQELAVQMKPSDPLTSKIEGSETLWLLDGKVVARTSLEGFAILPEEKAAVGRYFARHVDLHPQIRRSILASGQWPKTILIERRSVGAESSETLSFGDFKRQTFVYPVPAGLTSNLIALARTDTVEGRAMAQVLLTLEGKGPPKPTYDDILAGIAASAKAGKGLQGSLLFFEMTQLYPGILEAQDGLAKFRAINEPFFAVYRSPEAAQFNQASELAGKDGKGPERQAAARYLSKATELDVLQFGTFRYVTFANLVLGSEDSDKWDKAIAAAMPSIEDCYWTHIAAAPWAANTFYDLGSSYYSGYQTHKAWQLWDLGRAVDADWQGGVMKSIPAFEVRLRKDAPTSF